MLQDGPISVIGKTSKIDPTCCINYYEKKDEILLTAPRDLRAGDRVASQVTINS